MEILSQSDMSFRTGSNNNKMEILSPSDVIFDIYLADLVKKCVEEPEKVIRKSEILNRIQETFQKFLKLNCKDFSTQHRCLITGSNLIKTSIKGSDVDCTLLCPESFTENKFYDNFKRIMEEEFAPENMRVDRNFIVHIMKMTIDGEKFDLIPIFLQGQYSAEELKNFHTTEFRWKDEKSLLALKSTKTRETLLGKKMDMEILSSSVKILKCWARSKY